MKKIFLGPVLLMALCFFAQTASANIFTNPLTVPDGGTGTSTLDQDAFLLGNGTNPIVASSSPTLFTTLFDTLVSAYAIPTTTGANLGDVLSWDGASWTSVSTSSLSIMAAPAGTSTEIQFNDNGLFGADSNFSFYSSKVNPNATGPTMELGNDTESGVNIYTRYPDPAVFFDGINAVTDSGNSGTQMLIDGGNADTDSNQRGGTVWLVSGIGAGSGANGDINIYADNTNPIGGGGGAINLITGGGPSTQYVEMGPSVTGGSVDLRTSNGFVAGEVNVQSGVVYITGQIYSEGNSAPVVSDGSSNCGTSPTLVGTDNAGRITVGSGTNGGKCTVTFTQAWSNPPVCTVQEEGTSTQVYPANLMTTGFEITGPISAGDTLVYQCMGISY